MDNKMGPISGNQSKTMCDNMPLAFLLERDDTLRDGQGEIRMSQRVCDPSWWTSKGSMDSIDADGG